MNISAYSIRRPLPAIVFSIIAAIKANKGEWYTYPATIRFVS